MRGHRGTPYKVGRRMVLSGNVVAFYPVVMADHMKEVLGKKATSAPRSWSWCCARRTRLRLGAW